MSSDAWAQMRDAEQAMHAATMQRQAMQSQLAEIEHALGALPQSGDAWRIIGNLMVKRDAVALRAELTEKSASLRARADAAIKQEKELRTKLESLQQDIVKGE
jgi:prefoldin beta subunit